jgi:catechol 2,3-dioxygenase
MTPSLRVASIHLRVSNLSRSVDFYSHQLGFAVTERHESHANLATAPRSTALLRLTEDRHAAPSPPDTAGLFHAAVLFPTRAALAGWLHFTAAQGVDFEGFSDHGVSQAIYLSDPDGNGLEFYADRPRSEWPHANGELAMTTRPLAVRNLLAEAAPARSNPLTGSAWGHLHLRVTDLARSETFYRPTLGLEVTQGSYPGARFLAADGYHHHLGLNSWGNPRLPQPAGALGLIEATFTRATATTASALIDPDGLHLRIEPAPPVPSAQNV